MPPEGSKVQAMTTTLAVDCMGGDHGPRVTLAACRRFLENHPEARLRLVGAPDALGSFSHPRADVVPATEVVAMDDAVEVALRKKKDSSMRVAIQQVKEGAAQAAVSAGNTGALMALARYLLKTVDGIDRPAIASPLPNAKGGSTTVLDLGANVDCTEQHMLQFAVLGSALVAALTGDNNPTVGLLNIGEEVIKGNDMIKKAGELLKNPDYAATVRKLVEAEKQALAKKATRSQAIRAAFDRFYKGDIAQEIDRFFKANGGILTAADLAAYEVIEREPLHVRHRGRDIHTNPPPAAGGALLTQMLEALPDNPLQQDLIRALATPKAHLNRLGSTTHISVLDADGTACSVTTTNGANSGVSIAGVHLNNMMGEEDLSPDGFFSHAPGDRLPSMMSPTVVTHRGDTQLVLGSAGSSRICGAILQVLVNVLDRGMPAQDAVDAPRMHLSGDHLHVEPGIRPESELPVTRFRAPNMFFGGCQVVEMTGSGLLRGGADHRRGGAIVIV